MISLIVSMSDFSDEKCRHLRRLIFFANRGCRHDRVSQWQRQIIRLIDSSNKKYFLSKPKQDVRKDIGYFETKLALIVNWFISNI